MFDRIKKAVNANNSERCKHEIDEVKKCSFWDVADVNSFALWSGVGEIKANSVNEAKTKLIKKLQSKYSKILAQELKYIDKISEAEIPQTFQIEIKYTSDKKYTTLASAKLWIGSGYYRGRRAKGNSYNQTAEAISYALNQSPEIIRALFELEEKRLSKRDKPMRIDFIGGGCYYANYSYCLPRFDEYCCLSSMIDTLQKIGFNVYCEEKENPTLIACNYKTKKQK